MTSNPKKPVIGLIGGIGAGKSTVAAMLAEEGCVVVDADRIGHEVLEQEDVRAWLSDRWGEGVFDKETQRVNRRAVADIVFRDPAQLDALNKIMHPRIRRRMEEAISQAWKRQETPAVVIDAAVLVEAGWDELCTHLVLVESSEQQRFQRVNASRGWTRDAWTGREKSQICLDKKRLRCEYTIVNSSSASCLRERVRKLYRHLVHPADCSD
ncbi:MAG: dephospho-CoA kinase [Planctomycetes bacterium]|nr:dephospho-CoA kinase [Planctomycetota bacterium]